MKKFIIILLLLLFCNTADAQWASRRPTTSIVDLTDSGTEYSLAIGTASRPASQIQVKCRTSSAIRMAFASTGTSATYTTIPSGGTFFENDLRFIGTLYLRGNANSLSAEVLVWD